LPIEWRNGWTSEGLNGGSAVPGLRPSVVRRGPVPGLTAGAILYRPLRASLPLYQHGPVHGSIPIYHARTLRASFSTWHRQPSTPDLAFEIEGSMIHPATPGLFHGWDRNCRRAWWVYDAPVSIRRGNKAPASGKTELRCSHRTQDANQRRPIPTLVALASSRPERGKHLSLEEATVNRPGRKAGKTPGPTIEA
jgi:hypothetical protein